VCSSSYVRIKATSLTEREYLILIYLAADFLKPEGHRCRQSVSSLNKDAAEFNVSRGRDIRRSA
jgi:hypothetical protein